MPGSAWRPERIAQAMTAVPAFESLDAGDLGTLVERGRTRTYRKGTYLCHEGDHATEVSFLLEGRVEVASHTAGGGRFLHGTIETPRFIGELGVLGELDRTASVLALEEVSVWTVAAEDYLAFLADHPTVARGLLRALTRQVAAHEAMIEDLMFLDLKGRVAKRLLQLAGPSPGERPEAGASIAAPTHADLASMTGGSRENVTRILSEFQRRGLIAKDGRRFVLTGVEDLSRIAGL
jgi:CRP/FNR family transcriptional regulator/CRP/FNR family cyclic AMP-dependent transcriptional regulator